MKATIVCDSENTVKLLDYLIRTGSCNCRPNELKEWGIESDDTNLDVTFSIEKPASPIRIDVTIDEPKTKKKKKANGNPTLYAARCVETGKLVSDLTNPRRKYWDREGNARSAISSYNNHVNYYGRRNNHGRVELVKFELVEVPVNEN
jgi:hypothetical protein